MSTNYAVPPGAFLQEWAQDNDMSVAFLSGLLGWDAHVTTSFIRGDVRVTDGIAAELDHLTGIPADTWARYDSLYLADTARIEGEGR